MKDGGPAFPCVKHTAIQGNKSEQQREIRFEVVPGQSRRQWLAGLAMQALLHDYIPERELTNFEPGWGPREEHVIARRAYVIADAMLAYEEQECPPKP